MTTFRRSITVILTLLLSLVMVPTALAHPLGNFTVNQYTGLHVSRDVIVIDYVLDMAEIPAFQEIATFDANGNGQPDPAETAGYPADKCAWIQPRLDLSLNRQAMPLSLASSSVEFPTGVGGLVTLRLTCEFRAPVQAATGALNLSFQNNVFADRLGWQEIVVIPDGVTLQGEFSSTSPSNRLTNYPQDLLSSPLEQRGVELEITSVASPSGAPAANPPAVPASPGGASSRRDDAFTRLILLDSSQLTLPTVLLALAVAFIWGASHAMTPGHGKTIVGAYLVGSRGTLKHAVYLGLTTTITHTLGVFALGFATLFAAQYILPERLYPWMSLLSGLFVVGIGASLFVSRFKSSKLTLPKLGAKITNYSPVLQPTHAEGIGHAHKFVLNTAHAEMHRHDHPHEHDHSHADVNHSHTPPEEITWRNLLALGVSGGLIPCPSALVVLLGAIALNKIGFGLILVFAFSLGLAATLTAIGMLFIYAGRFFERFPSQGRIIQVLPVLSALFVSIIGVAIIWKALVEIGIV